MNTPKLINPTTELNLLFAGYECPDAFEPERDDRFDNDNEDARREADEEDRETEQGIYSPYRGL